MKKITAFISVLMVLTSFAFYAPAKKNRNKGPSL